jgi:hypothetical protein
MSGWERATSGATIGLVGSAASTGGIGLKGRAYATSGATTGILATVSSPAGTGLVINNVAGGKLFSGQLNGVETISMGASGTLNLPQTTGAAVGVITMGGTPFIHGYCSGCLYQENIFAGAAAGNFYMTGSFDTGMGYGALFFNSTGSYNTAVGAGAGENNATGSSDTFIGAYADGNLNNLTNATAIGYEAKVGQSNTIVLGGTGSNAVNVGIGTGAPISLLEMRKDVGSALGPTLTLINGSGGAGAATAIDLDTYDPSGQDPAVRIQSLDNNWSGDLVFLSKLAGSNTNPLLERMRLTNVGDLVLDSDGHNSEEINTSDSHGMGLIFGSSTSGEGIASCRQVYATCSTHAPVSGYGNPNGLDFYTAGTVRISLYNDGGIVIFDCTAWSNGDSQGPCPSDERLKTNIQSFGTILDKVAQLRPVHFNWKDSNPDGYPRFPGRQTGLIAQDVEKVFPELVTRDKNGYRRVDYGQLRYLTLEGVRELKERNDSLHAEVGQQQAEIARLNRSSAAKDARLDALAAQNRKLTSEVEQLRKEEQKVAALEARLSRDEAQEKSTRAKLARVAPGGKKQSHTEIARVKF